MIILPAIDIKDGIPVRLFKGDFSTVHRVAADALETALSFCGAGAEWLHTVDLDAAKDGSSLNREIFIRLAKETPLKVELGGGIRDMKTIEFYLERGISRVILGTAAIKNPQLVTEAAREFGERIAVGIDAVNGMVAAAGWLDVSDLHYIELAKRIENAGIKYIIFTDISRDGMLNGPNTEQLKALSDAVSCDIIASGGIKDIGDINVLKKLGMYGAICGKSIYSGTLNLAQAVKEAQ